MIDSVRVPPAVTTEIINPKEHFILNDSFNNIIYDVVFSIFKKYMCKAGCKICYVQNDWLEPAKFQKYIPVHNEVKSYIDRLKTFLSYFDVVSSIDDLRYIRDHHPDLFRFYQEHSGAFHLSSMTDNSVARHLPIIANNEVKFRSIREISLSEHFLAKANMKKLLTSLDTIHGKTPILKIKAIIANESPNPAASNAIIRWCEDNNIYLQKQYMHGMDISVTNSVMADMDNTRYSETTGFTEAVTSSGEFGEIFLIHSEVLFLMYDNIYSELKSATLEGRSDPFATLTDFDDPLQFLPKMLEGKRIDYRRYVDIMKDREDTYFKYFKYVSENLIINHDYNFIPRVAFKPYSQFHKKLVESGKMIDTPYGLVKPNSQTIIPIYTFKDNEPNNIQG